MARLSPLLELGRVAGEHTLDAVYALFDSTGEVAGSEAGQDRVVDDDLRQRVGEDGLEPTANFDADLALIGCNDKQDAVVLFFGTDAPMAPELITVVLDGIALQGGNGDDNELIRA
jgi:hypothetical protein